MADESAPRLLNERGSADLRSGRYREAADAFAALVQLTPVDPVAHFNRGLAQLAVREHGAAYASFARAVEIASSPNPDADLWACFAAMHEGSSAMLGAAQRHARAAVAARPDWLEARIWFAKALNAGNDKAGAEREFRAALELAPDSPEALEGVVDAMLEAGKIAEVLPYFDRLLAVRPDRPGAAAERTRIVRAAGRVASRRNARIVRYPKLARDFADLERVIAGDLLRPFVGMVPLLTPASRVFTLGSCFAANIANALRAHGVDAAHAWYPDEINSTYANVHFLRWLASGDAGETAFAEQFGVDGRERMLEAVRGSDLVIVSLGVAPCFFDRETGAFVPTLGTNMSVALLLREYAFRTTTVAENLANLRTMVEILRSLRPKVRIALTVSPVPLTATFELPSAIAADCISKSTLRVTAHEFVTETPDVIYWPSFEMVRWLGSHTGPVFGNDDGSAGHVSQALIEAIMRSFIEVFGDETLSASVARRGAPPPLAARLVPFLDAP